MNGGAERWLRTSGYTAVVLGGVVGWVLGICLALGFLVTTVMGSMLGPFLGLYFLSSLPLQELVLADSALILGGSAMVAASRR